MDEKAAIRVLFDIEMVALVAAIIGLIGYSLVRKGGRTLPEGQVGAPFTWADALLMWLPVAFFLINPIFLHLFPQATGAGEGGGGNNLGLQAMLTQFVYFGLIGGITFLCSCV
ncbi:MAG: hypothetical protein AAF226_04380, partial [Verrucomicrobiota bacterium]